MYKTVSVIFTFAISFLILGYITPGDVFSKKSVEAPITNPSLKVLSVKNSSTLVQAVLEVPRAARSIAVAAVARAQVTVVEIQKAAKIDQEMLIQESAIAKKDWPEFSNYYSLQEILLFESHKTFEQSIVYLEARLSAGSTNMKRLEKGILAMAIAETKPIKLKANHLFRRVIVTSGSGQMCISLKFCSDIAIQLRKS
jgi:hypothetical protein